jgi:hypothetical protein
MKTRRVFVSLPSDEWLTPQENKIKWAIVSAVEGLGYTAEVFLDPRGTKSLSASQAWSATACEEIMRRCEGCVLLGFARWRIRGDGGEIHLPTEYNHYEGAVAHTLGLPLLVLIQADVLRRVVFDASYKGFVGTIPKAPTATWLKGKGFQVPFGYWREKLANRRDVFLGYCSSSALTANKIKNYLVDELGVTVLDWAVDFDPATSILTQIEEASERCGAGIFIFTKDDALAGGAKKGKAVPRDNVVFEAGYYIALRGKRNVLIVRESDAKMPADLGGDIYASLKNKEYIEPIKPALRKFVNAL